MNEWERKKVRKKERKNKKERKKERKKDNTKLCVSVHSVKPEIIKTFIIGSYLRGLTYC